MNLSLPFARSMMNSSARHKKSPDAYDASGLFSYKHAKLLQCIQNVIFICIRLKNQLHALFRQIEMCTRHTGHTQRTFHQLQSAVFTMNARLALTAGKVINFVFHIAYSSSPAGCKNRAAHGRQSLHRLYFSMESTR